MAANADTTMTIRRRTPPERDYTLVHNTIIRTTRLTDPVRATYLLLISLDFRGDGKTWWSQTSLAAWRGISRKSINVHIGELKSLGLVEIERRGPSSSVLWVNDPPPEWVAEEAARWARATHWRSAALEKAAPSASGPARVARPAPQLVAVSEATRRTGKYDHLIRG